MSLGTEPQSSCTKCQSLEATIGDQASIVAHDLRKATRGINVISAWLAEDEGARLSAEGKQLLELLREKNSDLSQRLEAVFDWIMVGKASSHGAQFESAALIQSAAKKVQDAHGGQVDIQGQWPTLMMDPRILERLLVAVIENGVIHNQSSPSQVLITGHSDNEYFNIRIEDNGGGIPLASREKVFEIFHQVDGRQGSENLGMGLTLARRIVGALQGRIGLEESSMGGLRVDIQLPVASEDR